MSIPELSGPTQTTEAYITNIKRLGKHLKYYGSILELSRPYKSQPVKAPTQDYVINNF